jgi:hypothetical protein
MESGGISKLVHLVNGAGGSSVLRKPEGRVSDSSSECDGGDGEYRRLNKEGGRRDRKR